jgi:hypothetical protein
MEHTCGSHPDEECEACAEEEDVRKYEADLYKAGFDLISDGPVY